MPTFIKVLFFLGDLILINFSIVLSYNLVDQPVFGVELPNSIYLFIFSNLAWLFLVLVSNPYSFSRSYGILRVFKSQVSFIFVHLLIVASLTIFFKKSYAPIQLLLMYAWFVPIFFLWKLLILYVVGLFLGYSISRINFIIIGNGELAREVRKHFLVQYRSKYRFLSFFTSRPDISLIDQLRMFCKQNKVHEIYCSQSEVTMEEVKEIVEFGLNRLIKVKLLSGTRTLRSESLELNKHHFEPVLDASTIPLDSQQNRIYKRVFDIVFSFMVIVSILSWLIPLIGIAIKLDSRGPIFFKQRRAGRDNKPFYCFKLRTMVVNKEADVKQATKKDHRITKLGGFLRRTSLDEIPQFFNVFIGDMSVIGPRPHPIKLNEQFSESIERLMSRHYVKPGITGLAQCMGYRGETSTFFDMKGRVKLDRFYIENWSFALDIKIIVQTIVSLVRVSEKAY
jgi:putative colanic acid biosysnthesis UDP-glucose lipid carrier transferase